MAFIERTLSSISRCKGKENIPAQRLQGAKGVAFSPRSLSEAHPRSLCAPNTGWKDYQTCRFQENKTVQSAVVFRVHLRWERSGFFAQYLRPCCPAQALLHTSRTIFSAWPLFLLGLWGGLVSSWICVEILILSVPVYFRLFWLRLACGLPERWKHSKSQTQLGSFLISSVWSLADTIITLAVIERVISWYRIAWSGSAPVWITLVSQRQKWSRSPGSHRGLHRRHRMSDESRHSTFQLGQSKRTKPPMSQWERPVVKFQHFSFSTLTILRSNLLCRDFGLLCHSLSQPGHGARQRYCHPNSHTAGTLPLIHHRHVQRPANTGGLS